MSDERGYRWTDNICGCCGRVLDECGTCRCVAWRVEMALGPEDVPGSEWAESDEAER